MSAKRNNKLCIVTQFAEIGADRTGGMPLLFTKFCINAFGRMKLPSRIGFSTTTSVLATASGCAELIGANR
jgi:hypothetical protein